MSGNIKEKVFSKDVIEFVTVCVEYCAYLETLQDLDKGEVNDRLLKVLPLLYLKASMLPEVESEGGEDIEICVTEDDYNYILSKMTAAFGEDDVYLEVFLDDMKYSETPISASIAENLADIYQDTRNFITIYERGIVETMNDALYICIENFKLHWGQNLVNVLRALHSLRYPADGLLDRLDDEFDNTDTDDTW